MVGSSEWVVLLSQPESEAEAHRPRGKALADLGLEWSGSAASRSSVNQVGDSASGSHS
jgi:hypothetical protein